MKRRHVIALLLAPFIAQLGAGQAVHTQASHLDIGWSDEFNGPGRWEEDLGLLRRPAARRLFRVLDGHGEFQVSDSTREARWTETTEPIWASDYKYFVMRYRAGGINPHSGVVVALRPGSVGPVTPGASNPENPFAKGANLAAVLADELVQDGAWHLLVKDLSPQLLTPQLDQIMVTVGAGASGDAHLEIDYLHFVRTDPRRALEDFLPVKAASTLSCSLPECSHAAFLAASLHPQTSVPAAEVMPELGIRAPWLGAKWFTFAGLPFANGGIAATTVEGRETLTVPIGTRASEIYLLLGTSFVGTGGPALREPERFTVEVEYADGAVDQFFPFNLTRQAFVMENHSLGVYLVAPSAWRFMARMKLCDHMSNGAFYLFGATLNVKQPVFPRIEWVGASIPPESVATNPPTHPAEVKSTTDRLILENTFYRYEFSTAKSVHLQSVLNKFGGTRNAFSPGGRRPFFLRGVHHRVRIAGDAKFLHG